MTDKVSIKEIADELGVSSKEVLECTISLSINAKTAQSKVSMDNAEAIANYIMNGEGDLRKSHVSDKVSIKEIADELGIASKDVLSTAIILGFNVKAALSKVSMDDAEAIANHIMNGDTLISRYSKEDVSKKISENQLKLITLEIKNLKSITHLDWSIEYKAGIHVIIAENGSGKSSLIISLAKLVQPTVYTLEFIGKGYEETVISFNLDENKYSWSKNPIWSLIKKTNAMPKINGFFESSVHNGTRFKRIDSYEKEFDIESNTDLIIKADDFIQTNMNFILYGDTKNSKKFSNLYYIKAQRKRKNQHDKFQNIEYKFYALLHKETYVKEYFFSTGEYFLLSLLKFLYGFRHNSTKTTSIVIIDEVELSLHPLAQKRLMERATDFYKDFNILFIFATHSLQIIENVKPAHIHYLNNIDGVCHISNPIYPSYLSSKLYTHNSFDYVFLIEDKLAKIFIDKIIRKNVDSMRMSFILLPIGGWEKIYEMYQLNYINKIYGSAKVQIVFDGDVQGIKEANTKAHKKMSRFFLPFDNLEKLVIENLKLNDANFIVFFDSYAPSISISALDLEIKDSSSEEIKNTFKKFIKEFSNHSSLSEEIIIDKINDYIIKENKDTEKYKKFESNICDFLDIKRTA